MFKVNNENTRTTSVFIVNFDQVNANWEKGFQLVRRGIFIWQRLLLEKFKNVSNNGGVFKTLQNIYDGEFCENNNMRFY